METQKSRLEHFIKVYLGMSVRSFERSAGITQSLVAQAKEKLSDNIINKACEKYPMLNRMWLQTGDGPMINPVQVDSETQTFNVSMGDNSQVGGSGNIYNAGADAAELASLRAENSELKAENDTLRKEVAEKDKTIARLEGKIELYKEMVSK